MNGFIGLIPLLIVRLIILKLLNPTASQRAAFFAPLPAEQKIFYYLYQLTQLVLLVLPLYYSLTWTSWGNYLGALIWMMGLVISIFSVYNFSKPDSSGFTKTGIYRFSRNPMYLGYFVYYAGLALWMASWLYTLVLILFIWSSHPIIRAEEEWCRQKFGEDYQNYSSEVRRYL